MLFAIRAESAIIGTAIFYRSIKLEGQISRLDEFLGFAVIFHIIGN